MVNNKLFAQSAIVNSPIWNSIEKKKKTNYLPGLLLLLLICLKSLWFHLITPRDKKIDSCRYFVENNSEREEMEAIKLNGFAWVMEKFPLAGKIPF